MPESHAPTPYRAAPMGKDDPRFTIGPEGSEFGFIAITCTGNDKATAEFFCRACNSHDALLAACRAALPALSEYEAEAFYDVRDAIAGVESTP